MNETSVSGKNILEIVGKCELILNRKKEVKYSDEQ